MAKEGLYTRPENAKQSGDIFRRCLRCGNVFKSDGPRNRICSMCKNTAEWKDATGLGDHL